MERPMRYLITMFTHSAIPQKLTSQTVMADLDESSDVGIIDNLNAVNGVFSTRDGVSSHTREANESNQSAGSKQALQTAMDFVMEQEIIETVRNDQDDSEIMLISFGIHC